MLNQSGVETREFMTRKEILIGVSTSMSCIVSNNGVTEVGGKKIIKAGTPVSGDLTDRSKAFEVVKPTTSQTVTQTAEGGTASTTKTAVGIIRHDVDVTKGNANSQVVIFGTVDVSKLDSDVVGMITDDVKTALRMIQFVK